MKKFKSKLRLLLYILPLLGLHFTALPSNAANTSYDGKTLYDTYCAACHNNGTGGALPIIGVAGKGDDVSITKNAITTNKSRAGVTSNMSPYSFLTDTQLQAITNYTFPSASAMPVPTGQNMYSIANKETPVINAVPASAYPIGTGNLTAALLNWQIGLPAFSGQVDIIVAIQIGSTILFIDSNNQPVSNLTTWRTTTASGSKIDESITENLGFSGGNIPTSGVHGTALVLYLAVLPAGNLSAGNTTAFYLWSTQLTL